MIGWAPWIGRGGPREVPIAASRRLGASGVEKAAPPLWFASSRYGGLILRARARRRDFRGKGGATPMGARPGKPGV